MSVSPDQKVQQADQEFTSKILEILGEKTIFESTPTGLYENREKNKVDRFKKRFNLLIGCQRIENL